MNPETRTYSCGHTGGIPQYLGRGKARLRRIAEHFGRRCPACRAARLAEQAATLVHPDGRHYTADEQAAFISRHR